MRLPPPATLVIIALALIISFIMVASAIAA